MNKGVSIRFSRSQSPAGGVDQNKGALASTTAVIRYLVFGPIVLPLDALLAGGLLVKVASKATLDPLQLVRVKLARAECLAGAGFPAEAASALAGVLSGKSTPKTIGGYAGRRYCRCRRGRNMCTNFRMSNASFTKRRQPP